TATYFVSDTQAGGGIWNSPAVTADGSTLLVVSGEDFDGCTPCALTRSMISLDPSTLALRQDNHQGPPGDDRDFGSTPVIFHDAQGRNLVGANHKNGDFYTYVITDIDAGPLWSFSPGIAVGMMPAYDPTFGAGGTLFVYGNANRLFAVDPANGAY